MAYKTARGGPYPNNRGEFCGNHLPGTKLIPLSNESPEETEARLQEYLARMDFGKPSSCKAGTPEQMAAEGWVGLYLKEDRKLSSFETPVETNELTAN